MKIHADLSKRAVVNSNELAWTGSPLPGVQRRMLERDGEEVARATSIVRYAPNSYFSPHTHGGGEEFLVLDGIFSDEMGDFPQGMYVRNPIGSSHKPHSKDGTKILVKLQQFEPGDKAFVRIDTNTAEWQPGAIAGQQIMPLHQYSSEQVTLQRWAAKTKFRQQTYPDGAEFFVLAGAFADEYGFYPEGNWIRIPAGSRHTPFSDGGCVMYLKTGHL